MPGKFKYDASTSGKLLDLGVVVTDTSVKEFRSVCHNVNRLKQFTVSTRKKMFLNYFNFKQIVVHRLKDAFFFV